jgi:preprotein translocase subunit SecE
MSRAIRRQQQAAPKEEAQRRRGLGLRGKPTPTRGAKPPAQPRRRFLRFSQPRWLEDISSELRKVTWPNRDETSYLTMVVIIVALVVGAMLGGIDIFFNWLIDRLLLR